MGVDGRGSLQHSVQGKGRECIRKRQGSVSPGTLGQQDPIMPQGRNKKVGDVAEASKQSSAGAKTPKALKPEAKILKKPSNHSKPNVKEGSQKVERESEKANNGDRNKGKNITSKKESEKAHAKDQRNENNKEVGGMIFMCNARTKPDCFRYMVMGLPQSKKEIVTSIKPGLKLFLYDFDAKLLHGIYKASSAGGTKLEAAAFGGSYPSQVRFKVHMDCLPLSEAVFKKAIMGDSAGKKLMFNTELTVQQVKKLTDLFRPYPQLQPSTSALAHSQPVTIPLAPPGLIIPAVGAPLLPLPETSSRPLDESRQKETSPIRKVAAPRDLLSMTEKEYRTYGLKQELPKPVSVPVAAPVSASSSLAVGPTHGSRDPYYAYRIASGQYALPPRTAAYLTEVDHQTDLSRGRIDDPEYKLQPAAEQLATQPAYHRPAVEQLAARPTYHLSDSYGLARRIGKTEYGVRGTEVQSLHSTHAANALSDYNRMHQQPGRRDDLRSLPVSSRYSFAGPELSYR